MGIGLVIGERFGATVGERIGAGRGGAPTTTTHTLSIVDSADPVITGGDAFAYTAQYTNTGGLTANTVSVVITLDASLTYVSSSGIGWTINRAGQVVTCTRATVTVGAAPAITINVTTGGSAVSASTTGAATAANVVGTANASQGTTVNLVTKDATAGIYFPASSTEWTNFIARKGLSIAVPNALWLCQEASGNLADSIGSFTLTAAGTGLAYQQAVTGYSRKAITFTDAGSGSFTTTSASLPSLATQSILTMLVIKMSATPTVARQVLIQGGAGTFNSLGVAATTGVLTATAGSTVSGSTNLNGGSVEVVSLQTNRTAPSVTATTRSNTLSPTNNASVAGQRVIVGGGSTPPMAVIYACQWHLTNAEITDATLKAFQQALGFTITR